MKHLLKNTFPRYGKTGSSCKKVKQHGFLSQEKVFLLKLTLPNFQWFPTSEKSSERKQTVSTRQKISFHQPKWRIRLKICFHYMESEKQWRKWFSPAQNWIILAGIKFCFSQLSFARHSNACHAQWEAISKRDFH